MYDVAANESLSFFLSFFGLVHFEIRAIWNNQDSSESRLSDQSEPSSGKLTPPQRSLWLSARDPSKAPEGHPSGFSWQRGPDGQPPKSPPGTPEGCCPRKTKELLLDSSTLLTQKCLVTSAWILSAQTWATVAKLKAHRDPKQVAKPTLQVKAIGFFLEFLYLLLFNFFGKNV